MQFDENSHAYVRTNEDLRNAMEYMPINCKQALTVAASGDHPIFCSLHAALHYGTMITVDTFDVTLNAKLIMDIKTTAIGLLKRDEYARMLENLWWCDDALAAPYMDKVSAKLPVQEYEYLCSMRGTRLFDQGGWDGQDGKYLPTDFEYENLQEIIKKPYNFEQTDIANLNAKLKGKMYDFIHLSNIFDHIDNQHVRWEIIHPLLKRLNVGGRLVSYQLFGYPKQFSKNSQDDTKLIESILQDYSMKVYLLGLINDDRLNVFERVR